jgi:hypothetical protein
MTQTDADRIVRLVVSGDLDPIAAASQLRASGAFMIGAAGVGIDTVTASPLEGLRLQAFMGRLMWLLLADAGSSGLIEPTTLEEYRDFLLRLLEQDDDRQPPI